MEAMIANQIFPIYLIIIHRDANLWVKKKNNKKTVSIYYFKDYEIKCEAWDTNGNEDYNKLRPLSYSQTDVFLLMYDVSNRSSFNEIFKKWAPEVKHHMPNSPIVLCGNKIDLRNDKDKIEKMSLKGEIIVKIKIE
eukprot:TRINITY_DN2532_c0_g1_i2.p1 TRINITY_DN2532_c0_g1~~TRINITY_DN2532_c0_g1_i2.p1  ORF type:complete len:136 (-),score=20.60 TRINITY_DN2532_c0_g1_i2:35-442(-)